MHPSLPLPGSPPAPLCHFHLEGPVVSKSNHRYSRGSSSWQANRIYETKINAAARTARPPSWPDAAPQAPLAARPVHVAYLRAASALDAANISKSVLDALEGVLFANDAQVVAEASAGTRQRHDNALEVAVLALPPGTSTAEATIALMHLIAHVEQLPPPWPDAIAPTPARSTVHTQTDNTDHDDEPAVAKEPPA